MSEIDPKQTMMDALLRRSMAAPVPSLSSDFDQRLSRRLNRTSPSLARYRRILLSGYGIISIFVSTAVMRSQRLGWEVIALTVITPLAFLATVRWARINLLSLRK